MLDPKTFFEHIRGPHHLFSSLNQGQVAGINAILECWNSGPKGLFQPPVYDAHLAYMLATVYHETAQTMQAIKEGLHASDAWRKSHLRYYPYYGRGLVQLTWKANYQKATEFLRHFYPKEAGSIDLVNNPDQALDSKYAVAILFYGMSTGMFTGCSLHTFIHGGTMDFVHARKIINGMDRADLIAGYAKSFMSAVSAATKAYHGGSHPDADELVVYRHDLHLTHAQVDRLAAMADPESFIREAIAAKL